MVHLATESLGAVTVPVPPIYRAREVRHIANLTEAKVAVIAGGGSFDLPGLYRELRRGDAQASVAGRRAPRRWQRGRPGGVELQRAPRARPLRPVAHGGGLTRPRPGDGDRVHLRLDGRPQRGGSYVEHARRGAPSLADRVPAVGPRCPLHPGDGRTPDRLHDDACRRAGGRDGRVSRKWEAGSAMEQKSSAKGSPSPSRRPRSSTTCSRHRGCSLRACRRSRRGCSPVKW